MQSWASDAVRAVLEKPILVLGCGSIGRRHIVNLLLCGAQELYLYDTDGALPIDWIKTQIEPRDIPCKIGVLDNSKGDMWQALCDHKVRPAAVIICTPTATHNEHMKWCADEEIPFFVEKPISDNLDYKTILTHETWYYDIPNFVACNFRFTPGLQRVKQLIDDGAIGKVVSARAQFGQYLPDMRPNVDHKKIYAANKSMGGGCLLDGIHEFDYLSWLLGPIAEAKAFTARLTDATVDTEDVAEVILRFERGALASVHEDYVRRRYWRHLDVLGDKGDVSWCFADDGWQHVEVHRTGRTMDHWNFDPEEFDGDLRNGMYLAEMQHFLRVCAGEEKSMNTVADAYRLLETILNAK
jgi:predicted dehydrogenase